MYRPLFIYPNFSFSNPNQKQFERLLDSLRNICDPHVLTRKGPRRIPAGVRIDLTPDIRWREIIQHRLEAIGSRWAYAPDELRCIVNTPMTKDALRILKQERKDFICTLSFPLSAHLIGWKVKQKSGLPWITIFYDPWTDNPYRGKTIRALDIKQERLVAENADAIIHTNPIIAERWKVRYGSQVGRKIHILPFCYTRAMMENLPHFTHPQHNKIRISYIGQLVADRNLQDLIKACAVLKNEGYPLLQNLEVRVVGKDLNADRQAVVDLGLQEIFRFEGNQPAEKLEPFYLDTDYFLVLDAPSAENVFFPSKLMDYFYYQKPIIGITPEKGVTTELLKQSGNIAIGNGDIDTLTQTLKYLIEGGPDCVQNDKSFYRNFSPEVISAKFSHILHSILPPIS